MTGPQTKRRILRFPQRMLTRLLASHIFLVVIPLFITGHILSQAAKNSIEETIKRQNLEIAKRTARQVEQRLENVQDILRIVVENPNFFEMSRLGKELLLSNILLKYPVFQQIVVVSEKGEITSSTGLLNDKKILERIDLEQIFRHGSWRTDVFLSDGNLLTMGFCETIIDRFDQKVGALSALVDLRELWQLVDGIVDSKVLGNEGDAFIIKDDGQFIAHTDRVRVLAMDSLTDQIIKEDIMHQRAASVIRSPVNTEEMIMSYAPIQNTGWGIVLQQPTREAFAPADQMQEQVLMLMLGGLAVAALVAYFYTSNFLRPIERLVEGITKISRGDLYYRIEPLGKDEISQLAVHINTMSTKLRMIQNKLKRTERLETLGKLASVLSHEIRNPLNSMVINMQILRREYKRAQKDLNKLDHYHDVVVSEIKRVDELVSNFLVIAKRPKLEREPCDIAQLIDEILKTQQPMLLPKGIRVQRQFSQNDFKAFIDRNKVKQVFLNIVLNAAQAMPGGGKLTIELIRQDNEFDERGSVASIVFTDTGKGIPADAKNHIFDFYFSTKPEGTGVGLPVAQQIIEEHGGTITVESNLGAGAKFVVQLPMNASAETE